MYIMFHFNSHYITTKMLKEMWLVRSAQSFNDLSTMCRSI